MTADQFVSLLNGGGVLTLGALIGLGFYRRVFRLGRDFDDQEKRHQKDMGEVKQDRDEWKRLALRGFVTAERATTVAAAATERMGGASD